MRAFVQYALFVWMLLAAMFPCHVRGQGDVREGLLLYYDFNDSQHPAVDRSGNGQDGEIHGATWRPVGIGGGALYLRGPQDGVITSDSRMPLGDSPRSISCWISLDRLRQSAWTDILYYGTRANNQMAIMSIDWRLGRDCPDFSQWGGVYLSGRRIVQEGIWHHLVLTYNGHGQYAYYINGELWHGQSELHGKLNTQPGGTFAIGSHNPEEIHSIQGYIDEVRVYGRALAPEEALALYRAGASIADRSVDSTLPASLHATPEIMATQSTPGHCPPAPPASESPGMAANCVNTSMAPPPLCMCCALGFPITPKAIGTSPFSHRRKPYTSGSKMLTWARGILISTWSSRSVNSTLPGIQSGNRPSIWSPPTTLYSLAK